MISLGAHAGAKKVFQESSAAETTLLFYFHCTCGRAKMKRLASR